MPEQGVVAIPDAVSDYDHCVNAANTDAVAAVKELTGGRGADVVIESAGGPPREGLAGSATVDQSFEMVRHCGRFVINSLIPGTLERPPVGVRDHRRPGTLRRH